MSLPAMTLDATTLPAMSLPAEIAAVRRFNRLYTQSIGVLDEGHLASPFSLAESRVLYEIAHREGAVARDLAADLGLDQGYLSRILARFERRGLIARTRSPTDGRQSRLALTAAGAAAFADLDRASEAHVGAMISGLSAEDRQRLVGAMERIARLLGHGPAQPRGYLLRPPRPGDLGFVVHRPAALYTEEYGWDGSFEAMLAEIVAGFITRFDPARDGCWIAEREGEIVGSVLLVGGPDGVAKLRLLYVEPSARGLGIGRRLVEECIAAARRLGNRRLTLWTNDILVAARRIYETAGFRLVREEPHRSFGRDLVGQTWDLDLAPATATTTAAERAAG